MTSAGAAERRSSTASPSKAGQDRKPRRSRPSFLHTPAKSHTPGPGGSAPPTLKRALCKLNLELLISHNHFAESLKSSRGCKSKHEQHMVGKPPRFLLLWHFSDPGLYLDPKVKMSEAQAGPVPVWTPETHYFCKFSMCKALPGSETTKLCPSVTPGRKPAVVRLTQQTRDLGTTSAPPGTGGVSLKRTQIYMFNLCSLSCFFCYKGKKAARSPAHHL